MRFFLYDGGTIQRQAMRFEASAAASTDFTPVMHIIKLDMLRATGQRFQSQGRRGGGSWKQLRPNTVRQKGHNRILYSSGMNEEYRATGTDTLYRSVSTLDGPKQDIKVFKKSIHFGTKLKYAKTQQFGQPKKKVPARPFIRFEPYDIRRWEGMIMRHVLVPFTFK